MDIKTNISFLSTLHLVAKFEVMQQKLLRDMRPVVESFVPHVKRGTPVQSKRPFVTERGGNRRRPGHLKKSIGVIESRSDSYARLYVGPRVKGAYKAWYAGLVFDGHKIYRNPSGRNAKNKRNVLKRYRRKSGVENVVSKTQRNPWTRNAFMIHQSRLTAEMAKIAGNRLQTEIRMKEK